MTPTATYRIQFNDAFTLSDACAIVPYLASLGVSHLYASPLLTARPGSPHGYDITDHGHISPSLGGIEGLRALSAALRARGMGLLLDIVPNHMGVGGADNALWLDVLEWGPESPCADWFDIDWEPADMRLQGKVLAPFLGAPYGEVLAAGELRLRLDAAGGSLSVWYHEHRFPVSPRFYRHVLPVAPSGHAALDTALAAWRVIGRGPRLGLRGRAKAARQALAAALADPAVLETVTAAIARIDAEGLHELLERQSYRLCWWRAATDEINYRRFFDINGLAGFRVEQPAAFEEAHHLILDLWAEGLIDGVRIDHVDGLADPRAYCRKLRRRMEVRAAERPEGVSRRPWILVEKILARHETLPAEWQTDGPTGYEFMDKVGALLHDPAGEPVLDEAWAAIAPEWRDFHTVEHQARREILQDYLAAELAGVALVVHRVLQRNLSTRDYTLTAVRRVLAAVVAEFPVYRTYAALSGGRQADGYVMDWAFTRASRAVRATQRDLLALVRPILSGEALRGTRPGAERQEMLQAIRRFQQLTGPVAAKSTEDTAFYRYVRLISRNEVGSYPGQLSINASGFHGAMRARRRMPLALSATATHDHKRGEDVRARLAVVSSRAGDWVAATERWRRLNVGLLSEPEGIWAPDPVDELHLYQTLVGAWPLGLDADDRPGVEAFVTRVEGWFVKALREAKRRSDWAMPNAGYEDACLGFLRGAMEAARPARFDREVAAFAGALAGAGASRGLVQTTLRCVAPGIPDLYQGTELWDFSLVDPDNRRPVDFWARAAVLAAQEIPGDWRDGHIKLLWTATLLRLRRDKPALFQDGSWDALTCRGALAGEAIAAARSLPGGALIVLGLPMAMEPPMGGIAPERQAALAGTQVNIPEALRRFRRWRLLAPGLAPREWSPSGSARLDELLAGRPAAVAVALD
ncbi:maltooligosyl trehalose synthase [Humitalea rosea]|uniref:Maltooligosyl trehalose synthase n=1 Tax=Humitalea rosea TaxID=990373 RepID=A0A2W7IVI6_9PROT|nr:malto-oligosyltrehalose synthase [Humitalea rosea]PZW50523.1 maltooligosyl trehalose synthase [Humitalea rosea]